MTVTNPRQALIELANELFPESFDTFNADIPLGADWYAYDVDARLKTITEALTTNEAARQKLRLLSAAILAKHYYERGEEHISDTDTMTALAKELSEELLAKDYTILVLRHYHGLAFGIAERITFQVRGQNPYHAESMLRDSSKFKLWFDTVERCYQTDQSDLTMVVFNGKDVNLAY